MAVKRKFKSGDLVMLVYGGDPMTVKAYLSDEVICQWYADGKLLEGYFREASLRLSPKKKNDLER